MYFKDLCISIHEQWLNKNAITFKFPKQLSSRFYIWKKEPRLKRKRARFVSVDGLIHRLLTINTVNNSLF